jgi:hypothetical protein
MENGNEKKHLLFAGRWSSYTGILRKPSISPTNAYFDANAYTGAYGI